MGFYQWGKSSPMVLRKFCSTREESNESCVINFLCNLGLSFSLKMSANSF